MMSFDLVESAVPKKANKSQSVQLFAGGIPYGAASAMLSGALKSLPSVPAFTAQAGLFQKARSDFEGRKDAGDVNF